jgi:hypothetical protein
MITRKAVLELEDPDGEQMFLRLARRIRWFLISPLQPEFQRLHNDIASLRPDAEMNRLAEEMERALLTLAMEQKVPQTKISDLGISMETLNSESDNMLPASDSKEH